jgi:citronellol/citronellal dehydrogenase
VTGASRGIGRAIALRAARDGANVVIAAKTVDNSGKLKGSIHDVAKEAEAAGGRALALQVDVRDADRVTWMIDETVKRFGGVDALINNAGAIALIPTESLPLKWLDLMFGVNVRAAIVASRAAIPHLRKSANPHILSISPPIDLNPRWLAGHAGYTISKYGVSMLTIGLAEELRGDGIAVNSLWPRTTIATAAVQMLGGDDMVKVSRTPDIVADAAHAILTTPSRELTGRCLVDEPFLRERGVADFERYAITPGGPLFNDLYISE